MVNKMFHALSRPSIFSIRFSSSSASPQWSYRRAPNNYGSNAKERALITGGGTVISALDATPRGWMFLPALRKNMRFVKSGSRKLEK
jgi:hypothetical protein